MSKVLGYGWIKSGDTLKKALEEYNIQEGDLKESIRQCKVDVRKKLEAKDIRKSAKPRFFRVVLEELE